MDGNMLSLVGLGLKKKRNVYKTKKETIPEFIITESLIPF